MLLEESVNVKNYASIWFLYVKKMNNQKDKRKGKTQSGHLVGTLQKAHTSGEFVAMCCFGWPPALRLWSSRQADQNLNFII